MNTEYALVGKNIVKKYKNFTLSLPEFHIPQGFATALIGENGAGKSTLLNVLTGLRLDYTGELTYFGQESSADDPAVKNRIAYTGPNNFFLPQWTVAQVAEISELLFDTFDRQRFEAFCNSLNIPSDRAKTVKSLSDGNRMKLMLATAFCRKSDLLLMDEPASPLDPLMRDRLCELIREYISAGNGERSVLFSTHNIADMEGVTDYAIIMDNGAILEEGFVEELKEKYLCVKGEQEDTEKAAGVVIGMSRSRYGFEGLVLASDLEKLAGLNIALETPNLSQISVGIMREHSGLRPM